MNTPKQNKMAFYQIKKNKKKLINFNILNKLHIV